MTLPNSTAAKTSSPGQPSGRKRPRYGVWIATLLGVAGLGVLGFRLARPWLSGGSADIARGGEKAGRVAPGPAGATPEVAGVRLSEEQQRSIGMKTQKVVLGDSPRVTAAPGRVAPNEYQYAFITPRAAGVVRSVTAHIGQEVKAGDLLATIDSPEVGEARLDLYTKLQNLDIARSQAAWEQTVYGNTLELLAQLRREGTPEQVHESLRDRAVGENREKLMTAYAEFRLARATLDRNNDLFSQKLITPKDFERVKASYDVAQATYQSLMEEMGYEVKLKNTRAQQALKQAETAVRAARERLRILGVNSDGTEPPIQGGKVVGLDPVGSHSGPSTGGTPEPAKPEAILPPAPPPVVGGTAADRHSAPHEAGSLHGDTPVSTYSIWAPFDGTILDREMIVPGVAVDKEHRIFTMANLATVWVEASVHEGDFPMLDLIRKRGGKLRFRSPAYPDRVFEGSVNYTGDLVEEKSRTVKLLAQADNPERLLRPGMFVEVEVLSPRSIVAMQIPASAVLVDGGHTYVYVRGGPDSFERREVEVEAPRGDSVAVRGGLAQGDEVVVEGGFKLKAIARGLAAADH